MGIHDRSSRKRRLPKAVASGLGLVGLGAVAGTVASTAMTASAATSTTTTPSSSTPSGPNAAPPAASLSMSGTVTAVGSSSVTIQTSSGRPPMR